MTVTLLAELCYPHPPDLDRRTILTAARVLHPGIEWMSKDAASASGPIMFAFPELSHTFTGGKTAQLVVAILPGGDRAATRDLSQTWDWDDASAALQASPHTLVISELMGRVHPPHRRVEAFRAIVDVLIAMTEPAATWWPVSGRAMAPGDVVLSRLGGLVNVRMFNDAARPGNVIMDTVGLHALGLPDVEIYFRDLEPGTVAGLLYDIAHYLLDGNEIEDGHTVQGLSPEQRWPARMAASRLEPGRAVLTLNPGT